MENLLNNSNIIIGMLISLFGGFLASFSPCSLSAISLIIGYVSKTNDSKNSFKYSILFAIGSAVTFVILGIISVLIGQRIGIYNKIINIILAIVLIVVSLNMFNVIEQKEVCKVPKFKKNVFYAFILGILGGIINTPCSAPILITILTYTAMQNNLITGIIFMLFYSIGNSILIILAGTSVGFIQKLSTNEKYIKLGKILKKVFGLVTLGLALYLLYQVF